MAVTALTWIVAITGLVLVGLLTALQLVAVVHPRGEWTVRNVYGGDPTATDPRAYFAFNQGYAWADPFVWAPFQIAGSLGMRTPTEYKRIHDDNQPAKLSSQAS